MSRRRRSSSVGSMRSTSYRSRRSTKKKTLIYDYEQAYDKITNCAKMSAQEYDAVTRYLTEAHRDIIFLYSLVQGYRAGVVKSKNEVKSKKSIVVNGLMKDGKQLDEISINYQLIGTLESQFNDMLNKLVRCAGKKPTKVKRESKNYANHTKEAYEFGRNSDLFALLDLDYDVFDQNGSGERFAGIKVTDRDNTIISTNLITVTLSNIYDDDNTIPDTEINRRFLQPIFNDLNQERLDSAKDIRDDIVSKYKANTKEANDAALGYFSDVLGERFEDIDDLTADDVRTILENEGEIRTTWSITGKPSDEKNKILLDFGKKIPHMENMRMTWKIIKLGRSSGVKLNAYNDKFKEVLATDRFKEYYQYEKISKSSKESLNEQEYRRFMESLAKELAENVDNREEKKAITRMVYLDMIHNLVRDNKNQEE